MAESSLPEPGGASRMPASRRVPMSSVRGADARADETSARTVFLVRHGRTALNAAGVLRGRLDPPLDDVGREEATAVAALFTPVPVSMILSSPLRRARETAEPIAAVTGARLLSDEAFIDRDYGPWAGVERAAVEARYGSLDRAPGVEPFVALVGRTTTALRARASTVEPLLVVAHDVVNRAVLTHLAVNVADDPDTLPQRTGCWNQLECRDGVWRAVVVDAVAGDGQTPAQPPS